MKYERHSTILKLIKEKEIHTQDELADELKAMNIEVTQATVSRDIRELKLHKTLSTSGDYRYVSFEYDDIETSKRLSHIFAESVISIESAENIVVIKTIAGGAQAAASAIDVLNWSDIVGSIAGDDTIFVAVREAAKVDDVIKKFEMMLKGIN